MSVSEEHPHIDHRAHLNRTRQLLFDFAPEHEVLIVKNQKSTRSIIIGEFMPLEKLEELKKFTVQFKPPTAYTAEEYEQHIQDALLVAKRLHAEEAGAVETVRGENRKIVK